MEIKDSGTRRKFESGAVRDAETGKGRFDLITPIALTRLAQHYEGGAIKYDARNWEKGIPLSTFMDSALRHLNKYREGLREEDHMVAALWNVAGFIHTEEMIKRELLPKELDDLPSYVKKKITIEDLHEVGKLCAGIPGWIEDLPSLKQLNDKNEEKMKKLIEPSEWLADNDGPLPSSSPATKKDGKLFGIPVEHFFPPSPKPQYTAYFSHHIRGVKGEDATDAEQDANREDAIKVCNQLRELLPDWKIYCPAEVDEIICELFKSGAIGEDEILDADCEILERRDILFAYTKDNHISRGMRREIDHAEKKKIPIFYFSIWNEYVENALQHIQNYGVSK